VTVITSTDRGEGDKFEKIDSNRSSGTGVEGSLGHPRSWAYGMSSGKEGYPRSRRRSKRKKRLGSVTVLLRISRLDLGTRRPYSRASQGRLGRKYRTNAGQCRKGREQLQVVLGNSDEETGRPVVVGPGDRHQGRSCW